MIVLIVKLKKKNHLEVQMIENIALLTQILAKSEKLYPSE